MNLGLADSEAKALGGSRLVARDWAVPGIHSGPWKCRDGGQVCGGAGVDTRAKIMRDVPKEWQHALEP